MLLDEDSQARYLINLLQAAGHDVVTVKEIGLMNRPDSVVLDFARQSERVLLTRNCNDFQELHQINPEHSGVLAIYQDSEMGKNMNYQGIVQAIENLEAADYVLKKEFIVLNHWGY